MTWLWHDALPDMQPGDQVTFAVAGHSFQITATREVGYNTGRRRYRVECVNCAEVLHEATTGPLERIQSHLPDPASACDHGVTFEEGTNLSAAEVRQRWPRLDGVCPKGCGFRGIAYASLLHYASGDW